MTMKRPVLALAALGAFCACADDVDVNARIQRDTSAKRSEALPFAVTNPLVETALADPEIHRFKDADGKDVYWIYGTHDAKHNIGAAYSKDDMKTWTFVDGVLDVSTFPWATKHRKIWAPSCLYRKGKYYLSFSSGNSHGTDPEKGVSIGVADNPGGPFKSVKDGPIYTDYIEKAVVIDQDLFMDEDGQVYMYYGGGGRCVVVMLNDTLTGTVPLPDGSPYRLLNNGKGAINGYMEGPFMIKRGKTYYLMYSRGIWSGPSYSVAYSTSDSPLGPFRHQKAILTTADENHKGPGHNSAIYLPEYGRWLICYHRWGGGRKFRAPCVDALEFDGDGSIRKVVQTDGWGPDSAAPAEHEEAAPSADVAVAGTKISIDASNPGREITDYIFGVNHRYSQCGYGMFDPKTMKVRPDFLEKSRHAVGAVRWPGGTIANLVDWKQTIGPVKDRKNQILGNRQRTEDFPYYGIDEHMAYCEEIGAKCVIMAPFAAGNAADAADLVEYLNSPNDGKNPNGGVDWAKVRAKNGHPAPYGVKYFEIGNEMWDPAQRYWMGRPSAEGPDKDYRDKYANGDTVKGKGGKIEKHDGFVDFAAQMKKVDPSILVFSCIGEIWEYAKDTSNCDGVTIHEYRVLGKAATKREMYDRWILSGDRMTKSIPENIKKAKAKAPRKDTHVIVTEFGVIPVPAVWTEEKNPLSRDEGRMLGRALHFAAVLAAMAESEEGEMMLHQGYTAYSFGGGQGLGSAGNVFNAMYAPDPDDPEKTIASAVALAYELFEPFRGGRVLASSVDGNAEVSAVDRKSYKSLVTLAARTKRGGVALLVINRDPENAIEARIDSGGRRSAADGKARVRTLNADDFTACNTPAHPDDVRITSSAADVSRPYSFPAHSITLLEF